MNEHQKGRHRAHRHQVKRRRKERKAYLELVRRGALAFEAEQGGRRMTHVDEAAFIPASAYANLCETARRETDGEG